LRLRLRVPAKHGPYLPKVDVNFDEPATNPAQEEAREYVPAAIRALREIAMDKKCSSGARVSAASKIVDIAYGRPGQQATKELGGGGLTINIVQMKGGKPTPIHVEAEVVRDAD
jgi:hypothetical protein